MNQRLKIIGSVLGIVYLFFVVYTTYYHTHYFIAGFLTGMASAKEQRASKTWENVDYIYFKVMPKEMTNNFFPVQITEASGKMLNTSVSEIALEASLSKTSVFMNILRILNRFLSLTLGFIIIYLPYQIFRVFYSVARKDIFDFYNYKIFNKIGFAILYTYIVMLLSDFTNYLDAKQNIFLKDYDIILDFSQSIYILFIGIISLFFAEVLKIATTIKEDQKLTI